MTSTAASTSGPETPAAPPLRGVRRTARVVALGGSSLLLACGAHLVAGGGLPPAGLLAVVGFLVGLLATTLTARRLRLPLLVAVLGLEQLGLHWVFAASTSPAGPGACASGTSAAHHAVAAAGSGCAPLVTGPVTAGVPTVDAPLMWVAHAAAVVLTALLLARGEAWLWRAADRLVQVAHAAPSPRPRRRPRVAVLAAASADPQRRPDPLAAPRGPPGRLAVAPA